LVKNVTANLYKVLISLYILQELQILKFIPKVKTDEKRLVDDVFTKHLKWFSCRVVKG